MSFSQEELDALRSAFQLFDTEGKGTISTKELREVLTTLSTPSSSDLDLSLEKIGNDRELTFDDFVELLTAKGEEGDDVSRVFNMFDEDQKGYISIEDLKRVSVELGESMTDEELQEMMDRAASSGKVTLSDFSSIMNKKLFA